MQNAARIDRIRIGGHFLSSFSVSAWLHDVGAQQKDNIFLWLPVFLAIGIGFYFALPFEPPLALCLFLEICGLLLIVTARQGQNRVWLLFSISIFLMTSGYLAGKIRTDSVHTPMLLKKHGPAEVSGIIEFIEKMEEGSGSRIVLKDVSIEDLEESETPRKVRLRLRKDTDIQIGQEIRALSLLNPPSAPLAPGSFDFRRHLYFQGIGAVGFVYNTPEIVEQRHEYSSFINNLRHSIAHKIMSSLDHRQSSVVMALMVGQKNAISDDDRQAIRDAGLAHMLAISGLHVGLVASVLFYTIRLLLACVPVIALRYNIKNIAAVVALCGTIAYMFLAGSTVPTQRATLMTAIVFLAIILDRNPFSLRLVAFSAFIILLHAPESLMSASFHMSFAAVACLIYFYECTREYWLKAYRKQAWYQGLSLYFIGVCLTTIVASIATAPFSLYHFGQVSFIGSVANLIAVPLLAFIIMPFALLSFLAMGIGLEHWPLQVVGIGVSQMLEISYWASSLPAAIVRMQAWPFSAFLIMTSASLWMILWKGWGKLCALPFLILSCLLLYLHKQPDILISGSHKLFAVKTGEVLFVSSRRRERFVLGQWEKHFGLAEKSAQILPFKGEQKYREHPYFRCGGEGCRLTIHGQNVSLIRNNYVLQEECAWADVLVSYEPLKRSELKDSHCHDVMTIGKFETWKNGTHAVYLSHDNITLKTVADLSSSRPWSAY